MADPVLAALAAACPAARPAQPGDAVAGVMPRFAASPATVAEASELLRAATEYDLAVVPRGSGSKLDWGAPPRRVDLIVDTSGLDRVVEHAAGDLVVRVQAGVSLAQLGEVLAGAGQQLALDPPPCPAPANGMASPGPGATVGGTPATGATPSAAPPRPGATVGGTLATGATPSAAPPWLGATVGGIIATGAAGPRRLRYGTPRDMLIGITVVRADGTVTHSGGKVVKNVAGYDLGKLYTGSFGTLGLIVEAVFRLHPLPASAAYVTVDCSGADEAYRAVAAAADSELAPSAIELDRPARDQRVQVAVLVEGDPDGSGERASLMCALLGKERPQGRPRPAGGAARAPNEQPGNDESGDGQPRSAADAEQPGGAADAGQPGGPAANRGCGRRRAGRHAGPDRVLGRGAAADPAGGRCRGPGRRPRPGRRRIRRGRGDLRGGRA